MEDIEKNIAGLSSIEIVVKTLARKTKITCYDKEREFYLVDVAAAPENNEANIEIVKYFSRITKKKVKIIKGATSKKKVLKFG